MQRHFKGRSRQLRPIAHILDDSLGNPYDVLKVVLGPPYGPRALQYKGPVCPYITPEKKPSYTRCELWVLIGDSSL